MAFPKTVKFDLGDRTFCQQLVELKYRFRHLFDALQVQIKDCTGMPWEEFEGVARPFVTESAFTSSYIILYLHLLEGEIQIYTHLDDGILVLVSIHKPKLNT